MPRPTSSVDSLSIQITADAQNASQALNTLIKDIGNLSKALTALDMKNATAQMQGFSKAVKGVNVAPLVKNVTNLSNATGKYVNAFNKINNASRNSGSNFNNIGNGIRYISTNLGNVNNKLNTFTSRIKSANKESKNFAQTVGLLYARFFLLIRGVKSLGKSVKGSMDYIEVLNYFDSSMGQVAERGVSKWAEMGYDSAEAYYESFSARAKQVTKDMSGFFPDRNGSLSKVSSVSLGMNPQQLLQYQSQYAQMASSMGVASEQALKLSEVYTKLGADLASVKNLDFNEVWGNLASAMVGMSRTVDRYGANIRNANMQQKLMELGIDANVKSLSQADKALLRTIIILDSTKYAWHDLADTIDTPANQFRMLANNVKLLGQMIGGILLPVVAKVLPYLNALVIALQRLFTWLAKILGIDLSELMGKNPTPDNSALSDMLDEAEGLGDALDKDTDDAKKLKKQLQGFDALNNLTSKDDTAKDVLGNLELSGLLDKAFNDAVEKYLQAWREAFDKLSNKAEEIANKIANFFISLFAPIRRAWAKVGEDFKKSWKRAFKEVKEFADSFMISFWRVWGETDTQKIFEHIFGILADIGDIVANLVGNFKDAWNENLNGYHILSNIRDIILTIVEHFHNMSTSTKEWSKNIDFTPLLSKFNEFLGAFNTVVGHLMDIVEDFWNEVILPLGKWSIEEGLPKLLQVFIDFKDGVDWEYLKARLKELWEHLEPFAKRVGEGIILFIDDCAKALKNFLNSELFTWFLDKLVQWMDGTSARDVANTLEKVAIAIGSVKLALLGFKAIEAVTTTLKTVQTFLGLFGAGGALVGASANISATAESITGLAGAISTLGAIDFFKTGVNEGKRGKASSKIIDYSKALKEGTANTEEFAKSIEKNLNKTSNFGLSQYANELKSAYANAYIDAEAYYKAMQKVYELAKLNKDSAKWYEPTNRRMYDIEEIALNAEIAYTEAGKRAGTSFERNFRESLKGNDPLASSIIKDLDDSAGKIEESGKKLSGNALKGFDSGVAVFLDSASKTGTQVSDKFASSSNLAKATNAGKQIGDKYKEGVLSTEASILTQVSGITLNVGNKFMNPSAQRIAQNAGSFLMSGLGNGIARQYPSLMTSVTNIATNIANVFTKKWIIRSPSHLMDGIGVFFMKGLQNGIESMYEPIQKSVSNFSSELAQTPNFDEQLSFEGATAKVSSTSTQTFNADSSETNSLLRQQNSLLQAILEKEFGISEGALFKSVQNSASSYYKMTGNKAFA